MDIQNLEHRLVTPAEAKVWLVQKRTNRKPSPARVESHAIRMLQGTWRGKLLKPVLFDRQGRLGNGVHRVSAIVRAHEKDPSFKGVYLYIQTNVDDEDIVSMDAESRSQSISDTYQMQGMTNTEAMVRREAIYPIFRFENRNEKLDGAVCSLMLERLGPETLAFMERVGRPMRLLSYVRAALFYVYPALPSEVEAFHKDLMEGYASGSSNSTITALIKALNRPPVKNDATTRFKMVLHAINKYVENKQKGKPHLTVLKTDADGSLWARKVRASAGLLERITPTEYSPLSRTPTGA